MSNWIKTLLLGLALLCPMLAMAGSFEGESWFTELSRELRAAGIIEEEPSAEEVTEEEPTVPQTPAAVEVPAVPVPDMVSGQKAEAMWINGDTAYELYYFNLNAANLYTETVSRAAASLQGQTKVYSIIVPLLESMVLTDDMRHAIDPDWKNEVAAV